MGMTKRSIKSFRGFSLIELSVATAVFSMGLGSLSLMMLAAVQGTAEARHQTVATTQAESMAEVIAMSGDAYGHYVFPPDLGTSSCIANECQDGSLAVEHKVAWQQYLHEELPSGSGMICRDSTPDDGSPDQPSCDGNGPVVIKIFWKESRHQDADDSGLRRVVSRLPW
jgi:type IV pilus assembly protein PilV